MDKYFIKNHNDGTWGVYTIEHGPGTNYIKTEVLVDTFYSKSEADYYARYRQDCLMEDYGS